MLAEPYGKCALFHKPRPRRVSDTLIGEMRRWEVLCRACAVDKRQAELFASKERFMKCVAPVLHYHCGGGGKRAGVATGFLYASIMRAKSFSLTTWLTW